MVAIVGCLKRPALRPKPSLVSREEVRGIFGLIGWNSAGIAGTQLHQRLNVLISNVWLGLVPGMLFSLAGQLAAYIEQLTMGLVVGLDGMAAKFRKGGDRKDLRSMLSRQMLLQACLIFPATAMVLLSADELISLWIGDRLSNPEASIPVIALICKFLAVGIAMRSLTESWMKVLNGIGKVSRYSPFVLAGGLINPVVIGLIAIFLPTRMDFLAPAFSFVAIMAIVHLVVISRITSKAVEVPILELIRPCWIPLLATVGGVLTYLSIPDQLTIPYLPLSLRIAGFGFGFTAILGLFLIHFFYGKKLRAFKNKI